MPLADKGFVMTINQVFKKVIVDLFIKTIVRTTYSSLLAQPGSFFTRKKTVSIIYFFFHKKTSIAKINGHCFELT